MAVNLAVIILCVTIPCGLYIYTYVGTELFSVLIKLSSDVIFCGRTQKEYMILFLYDWSTMGAHFYYLFVLVFGGL
uniref:Uncharacterized protein n=1 Tax=Arundo donax TaxID=35708 RepID=A0A0A9DLU3_ARUDO